MALSLPTNLSTVEAWVGALYGYAVGTTTMGQINSDITSYGGLNNTLNAYYTAAFGSQTTATVAATIVKNVGLGTDAAAISYVTGMLNAATPATRGAAVNTVLSAFAGLSSSTNPSYATYAAAATAWATTVSTAVTYTQTTAADATLAAAATVVSNAAAAAAALGTVVSLTTGTDTATGSTINADLSSTNTTLQGFDVITGAGTTNKLNIIDSVAADTSVMPVGAAITNIQNITFNTSGNAGGASDFDVSSIAGLQSLTVTTGGTANDSIKAASTTNLNITRSGSTGTATTKGGNNVSITDNNSAGVVIGGSSIANNPTGAVTVVENAGTAGATVAIDGGTSVTVTAGKSSTGSITVGNSVAPSGAVSITNAGTGGSTITGGSSVVVNNTTGATSGAGNSGAVTIAAVTGSSNVTQSGLVAGDISITGGNGVTVNTTGGGAASAIVAGTTGSTTLIAGDVKVTDTYAGANTDAIAVVATGAVTINTTRNSAAISVGTGTSTDDSTASTVNIINATSVGATNYYGSGATTIYTNGSSAVVLKGGSISGGITEDAGASALKTVTLEGATGAGTITAKSSLSTLNISNNPTISNVALAGTSGPVVTVTNTTADNTLNLNLSNVGVGVTVTDSTAAVVNVINSGAAAFNKLTLTDANVPASTAVHQAVSIANNGTGLLQLGGYTNASGSKTAMTVSGSGKVDLGNLSGAEASLGTSGPASINSTSSGTVEVKIDPTLTSFTGGPGNSIVVLKDAGSVSKSIAGGAGTNDTIVLLGAAADYAAGLGAGITGFENLQLGDTSTTTTGATGTYTATPWTGSLINDVSLAPITFDQTNNNQNLTLLSGLSTASTTVKGQAKTVFTVASAATSAGKVTISINGETITTGTMSASATVKEVAQAITQAINKAATMGSSTAKAALAGVSASYATAVVTVSGVNAVGNVALDGTTPATGVTFTTGTTTAATRALNAPSIVTDTIASSLAAGTTNVLPITLGQSGATAGVSNVVSTASFQTVTVNSIKAGLASSSTDSNTLTILDSTGTATPAIYPVSKIVVTGNGSTNINYLQSGAATAALATIDGSAATGSLNVSKVEGAATGLTITGGAGALTAGGSGTVAGQTPTNYTGANDVITTGAGGGTITIGYGGAGGGAGSEVINLSASTAKNDTLISGLNLTANGGQRATITGFTSSALSTTADKITLQGAAVYSADQVAVGATTTANAITANTVSSTGLATNPIPAILLATNAVSGTTTSFGGTDQYTVSNGVISFTGNDSVAQKILNARGIVDAAGPYHVAAFGYGSDTYVIEGGESSTTVTANDTILKLSGVSNIIQLGGTLPSLGNIMSNDIGSSTATAGAQGTGGNVTDNTGTVAGGNFATLDNGGVAITQDDKGYAMQVVTGAQTAAPLHTFNNLAPSAAVWSSATSNWSLTTTQLGTAGSNALLVNLNGAGQTIDTLTTSGLANMTIASSVASPGLATVTSLVDTGNTLTSLTISNPLAGTHVSGANIGYDGALTIAGITDTALSNITISNTANVILGSTTSPLTQPALSVSFSGSSTYNMGVDSIYLSGAGAKITASSVKGVIKQDASSGAVGDFILSATGAGSTILGGINAETIIVGANGTVTMAQGSLTTKGNDAANNITVGANSTVTLGTGQPTVSTLVAGDKLQTTAQLATDAGSTIKTYTTSSSDVTGVGSGGAYSFVTINNVRDAAGLKLDLWNGGTTETAYSAGGGTGGGLINTASATSLSSALDMTAATLSAVGTREVGYFQYGGNTYVLGVGVAGETSLGASDVLVKLTGLHDASAFTVAGSVLTF